MNEIKSGLEIHQQLDTSKLFCECPSILRNDEPNLVVKRKLHAVKGESGEIDIAAKHEAEKDKEFLYYGYDTTCLVELDEEPPHLINQEALKIALHIALLLNCEILPVSQIMRKTVIDGSNTSGFQRTVLIARNGFVETSYGKVRIKTLFLEEDACRPGTANSNEDNPNQKIWKLDRLGIPLVEIATEPDIKSAEQCKEVALHIGDVLRSCKVKRGIGTIRQDVNVSIPGHPRVEIKGFQEMKMFIPVIENEIKRQEETLKSKQELKGEVRNAHEDGTTSFLRPMPGSARMYPETDLPLLYISRDIINEAKKTLPKLREEIREELKHKGLSEEMIRLLVSENKVEEFLSLFKIIDDANLIAKTMVLIPRDIASHENISNIDNILTLDIIESILHAIVSEKIKKEDIKNIMEAVAKGKSFEEAIKIEKVDLGEVEEEIAKIVKEKPGLSIGGYMGLIMQKFKGKINGKDATDILNKLIKK
ncbi:MAG: Glu-tRNA(Gln) amidotransferase subunit GatE [Candidatus Nanoarchaeia archaeon]|nr:Glu-tRNA(Gln) amidotransferase subunit GatE [Candidatus Nanoarchaeia archaeon]